MLNRPTTALAALLLAGLSPLAGCGGGEPEAAASVTTTPQAQARPAAVPARHDRATPADAGARTESGRYIGRAAAEQREAEGRPAIWVDAGCCAGQDPDLPQLIVFGLQAVHGESAPVHVHGSDLRQAARLADRLGRLGLRDVWLVTP